MNLRRRRQTTKKKAETIAADLAARSAEAAALAKDRAGDLVEVAPQKVSEVGAEVARRSADLRAHVAGAAHEIVRATAANPRPDRTATKRRTHRVRNVTLIAGAGAVAAYFLDPTSGRARREAARRLTSGSANAASAGFDAAARAAHQAAEATAPEPGPVAVPTVEPVDSGADG